MALACWTVLSARGRHTAQGHKQFYADKYL